MSSNNSKNVVCACMKLSKKKKNKFNKRGGKPGMVTSACNSSTGAGVGGRAGSTLSRSKKDLNIRHETLKTLEEKVRETLQETGGLSEKGF